MDKIFDPTVETYLKDLGISQTEINKIKFEKAKFEAISRLETVINCIKYDKFDEVEPLTIFSQSGHEVFGQNNYYINFGDIIGADPIDIEEICMYLKEIKPEDKKEKIIVKR